MFSLNSFQPMTIFLFQVTFVLLFSYLSLLHLHQLLYYYLFFLSIVQYTTYNLQILFILFNIFVKNDSFLYSTSDVSSFSEIVSSITIFLFLNIFANIAFASTHKLCSYNDLFIFTLNWCVSSIKYLNINILFLGILFTFSLYIYFFLKFIPFFL